MRDPANKNERFAMNMVFIACVMTVSALWMFWLSGYMLLFAGEVTASRSNFLFNADTSVWIDRIDRVGKPFWTEFSVSHPLRPWLWGLPARGLAFVLGQELPHTSAAVAAAKSLSAGLFGMAMGMVALTGMRWHLEKKKIAGLVLFFCLFSANAVVASTDHFGISIALMTASVCAVFLVQDPKRKIAVQFGFAFVIFGTTITNVLVPILNIVFILKTCYAWDVRRYLTPRILISALILGSVVVLAAFLWRRGYQGGSIILNLLNFRWINSPLSAVHYSAAALLYPVVAPIPWLGEHGITFEPLGWAGWSAPYALGAALWLFLLLETVRAEWRRTEPSMVLWILLPWLLFNIALHNIWGDEYFLFTPHWSWIFLFVLLLRVKERFSWLRAGMIAYLAIFQIRFFMAVHGLLLAS